MNQLLFIETFVFGAAAIAAVYHLVLFLQQRDKYLISYSIYLFSLSCYIAFKLYTDNYSPYEPSTNKGYFLLEEFLQISMVCIYSSFAAITLQITFRDKYVMPFWIIIVVVGVISISSHIMKAVGTEEVFTSRLHYGLSRFTIIGLATIALIMAWRARSTPFQRTIIIGSFIYDFSGFLSALSFVIDDSIFGLKGVEPYLVGCLADIIVFSAAFGYRIKKVAEEKNDLLRSALDNQLALEKVRAGIAGNLHDDVGSTLSSISIYSEAVKQGILTGETDKAVALVEQLGEDARLTISNMSDIVWAINPRNDSPEKLVSRMKSYGSEMCRAKNIHFNMKIEEDILVQNWSMTERNNMFLIFKEAINNSMKYAEATTITVRFLIEENVTLLEISDNGKGLPSSKVPFNSDAEDLSKLGGNGIRNMHLRAEEMKGELRLSSEQGTKVQLRLVLN